MGILCLFSFIARFMRKTARMCLVSEQLRGITEGKGIPLKYIRTEASFKYNQSHVLYSGSQRDLITGSQRLRVVSQRCKQGSVALMRIGSTNVHTFKIPLISNRAKQKKELRHANSFLSQDSRYHEQVGVHRCYDQTLPGRNAICCNQDDWADTSNRHGW